MHHPYFLRKLKSIFLFPFFLYTGGRFLTILIMIFGVIVFLLVVCATGFKIIRPIEKGLVERFGKYHRMLEPGLNWVIPLVDKVIRVNIAETQVDLMKQSVITKDNLNLNIDGVVYFKVNDPKKAIYNINNYSWAIASLAQTTLRSIVGEMEFVVVNAQRSTINARIEQELDVQTDSWGIDVLRVELQDIQPSTDVQIAMDKVVTAEREKEAQITRAIAEKESSKEVAEAVVIKAEADKRAAIEAAEGFAEARKIKAEAEAEAIRKVNKAVEETFKENSQKYKSLQVTESSLAQNAKIVLTEKGISPSIIFSDNATDKTVIPVTKK
ncbi:paraslipin [bacterium DOLZORAL124_38_8]|nr:MAG: paraslipin [bacterium DOLZORAL124_38_8]